METESAYERARAALLESPKRWLVTGGAGFIGSHLIDELLSLGQEVVCLDDFATGAHSNLEAATSSAEPGRFRLIEGDIGDLEICRSACEGVDRVLHHAALGSVPRSLEDPPAIHRCNVTGTLNLFTASREAGVRRIVYASSSSVYGDTAEQPQTENRTGRLLSPYAASKASCETYAEAFAAGYDMEFAGLRYFNVFGPRQDPHGPYAAVIPIWAAAMLRGDPVTIHGDGETTRDFTYVPNVVQANLLAATAPQLAEASRVFNVAAGCQVSLNRLFEMLRESLGKLRPDVTVADPVYGDFRPGDIRHSGADCARIREELGFQPSHSLATGLDLTMAWYLDGAPPPPRG